MFNNITNLFNKKVVVNEVVSGDTIDDIYNNTWISQNYKISEEGDRVYLYPHSADLYPAIIIGNEVVIHPIIVEEFADANELSVILRVSTPRTQIPCTHAYEIRIISFVYRGRMRYGGTYIPLSANALKYGGSYEPYIKKNYTTAVYGSLAYHGHFEYYDDEPIKDVAHKICTHLGYDKIHLEGRWPDKFTGTIYALCAK